MSHQPSEVGVEEARRLLPYWARELLRMWEEAERRKKARKPSAQETF
ncbi:MAG: hypothetical protein QXJ75_02120 [Candidatus Bathyarchaeia archaeon]